MKVRIQYMIINDETMKVESEGIITINELLEAFNDDKHARHSYKIVVYKVVICEDECDHEYVRTCKLRSFKESALNLIKNAVLTRYVCFD